MIAPSFARLGIFLALFFSPLHALADARMMFHQSNGAAWSPLYLGSNLVGWFDSSDFSTMYQNTSGTTPATIGTSVALWKDKSGHHYDATQSTTSQQPTLTRAGLIYGGNTPQTVMISSMTISNMTSTNQASFYAALNVNAGNGYGGVATFRGTGCTGFFSNALMVSPDWWSDNLYGWTTNVSVPAGVPSVEGFVDYGTSQLASANGNVATQTSTSSTIPSGQTTLLNIGQDTHGGRFFYGTIAELVIVNTGLSTANRQMLEGYLAWKWGSQASLPAGHPYQHYAP